MGFLRLHEVDKPTYIQCLHTKVSHRKLFGQGGDRHGGAGYTGNCGLKCGWTETPVGKSMLLCHLSTFSNMFVPTDAAVQPYLNLLSMHAELRSEGRSRA